MSIQTKQRSHLCRQAAGVPGGSTASSEPLIAALRDVGLAGRLTGRGKVDSVSARSRILQKIIDA